MTANCSSVSTGQITGSAQRRQQKYLPPVVITGSQKEAIVERNFRQWYVEHDD